MTKEQFDREKNFLVSLSIAKKMLTQELINQKEYDKINEFLVKHYRPIIGSL